MIIVVDLLGTASANLRPTKLNIFASIPEQRFHVSAASSIPLAGQAIISTRLTHF